MRADARRNRARVLAAAQEAFAAEGLSVPLDEIARRAGVGAGTVYRHFPTKEALFEAVIAERMAKLVDDAQTRAGGEDPGAAFFEFFAETVERAMLNKDLCEALEAGGGPKLKEPPAGTHQAFTDGLGELLARAQGAGAVRDDVDVVDVRALLVGCVSMERQVRDVRPHGHMVALACDSLRPRRAE